MIRRSVLGVVMALSVMAAVPAFAVQPDEVLADRALEQRARALSAEMRCLVCQNQSIDDSDAPLARDLRLLIRERLKAGDDDEQIVDYVVSRYGEFVLLRPRLTAKTVVLWGLPFAVLLGVIAYLLLRRRRMGADVQVLEAPLSADEQKKLEALLKTGKDA